jgi:hypothetical protein
MHDATVDCTTNGKGKVADYTLEELRRFRLEDGLGTTLARQQIPTLEEVMTLCKGRVLVNVDKAGDYMDRVQEVLRKTGTKRQAVYKGEQPCREVRARYGPLLDSILYMPMLLSECADIPLNSDGGTVPSGRHNPAQYEMLDYRGSGGTKSFQDGIAFMPLLQDGASGRGLLLRFR